MHGSWKYFPFSRLLLCPIDVCFYRHFSVSRGPFLLCHMAQLLGEEETWGIWLYLTHAVIGADVGLWWSLERKWSLRCGKAGAPSWVSEPETWMEDGALRLLDTQAVLEVKEEQRTELGFLEVWGKGNSGFFHHGLRLTVTGSCG